MADLRLPTHCPPTELEHIEYYSTTLPQTADISSLTQCTRLYSMRIWETPVPARFLEQVMQWTQITKLAISRHSILEPSSLDKLGTHLRELSLSYPEFSLTRLAQLTQLEHLELNAPHSQWEILTSLKKLTFLLILPPMLKADDTLAFSMSFPRLRTLRLETYWGSEAQKPPLLEPIIENMNLTSLSLGRRDLDKKSAITLAATSTIKCLSLANCKWLSRPPDLLTPLAKNTVLTWLDVGDVDANLLKPFMQNSTLTGLQWNATYVKYPKLVQHIEANRMRVTAWIRRDFMTMIIYFASQRVLPSSSSPWRLLPLDVVKSICRFLEMPDRPFPRLCAFVEFVYANIAEIWAEICKSKRGVKILEAVVKPRSRFRWQVASKEDDQGDERCTLQ